MPYGTEAFGVATNATGPTSISGSATLQDAINAATNGGNVDVASGTYTGSLSINKDLTISNLDAPGSIVINANNLSTGISIGASNNVHISGIKLQNVGIAGTAILDPGTLDLENSQIDASGGALVGINVDGSSGHGSLTLGGTTISGAGIFDIQVGGPGTPTATVINSELSGAGTADVIVTNGTAQITQSIISSTSRGVLVTSSGFAKISDSDLHNNTLAITNTNTNVVVDASENWWGTTSDSGVLAKTQGNVDITPLLVSGADTDGGAVGFVGDLSHLRVTSAGPQAGLTGRIQEAIDDLADGSLTGGARIVDVGAGTYVENVVVNKSLQLLGPNAGTTGYAGGRVAEAIIEPPADQHTTTPLVFVQSSNVTISGLTLDGSNPNLGTGALLANSLLSQSAYGISNASAIDGNDNPATAYAISHLTVSDNIVQNFAQSGIAGDNGALGATSNNLITDNLVQNISANTGDSFGYAVLLLDNFYATITGNHILTSQNALQVENFFLPDPVASPSIDLVSGNFIDYLHRGIFLNLQYQDASSWAFDNNSVSADINAGANNKGISIESIQGTVSESFTGNSISGSTYGYELWNMPTTGTVLVSGGTVTGTSYGVWVTNNAEYGLADSSSSAEISGVTISGATTAAIYIEGDIGAGTNPLSALIDGNTSISGSPTGILVSGNNATATISGDHIYDNSIGILFRNGGKGNVDNNNFEGGALDNGTDLRLAADAGLIIGGTLIGNTFAGATFIDQEDPQNMTALRGPACTNSYNIGGLPTTDDFAIENRIFHKIDNAASGLVTWLANTILVSSVSESGSIPTATDNDFTRIQNALDAAQDNYTIELKGTFDWTEANAFHSWSVGDNLTDDGGAGDDYTLLPRDGLDGVTLTAASGLESAKILGPGNLPGVFGGFLSMFSTQFTTNQNWTISDLDITGFTIAINMSNGPNTAQFSGTHIVGNHITIPQNNATDDFQDVGINYSFGKNQVIQGNTFDMDGGGVSDSAHGIFAAETAILSNTSGGNIYDGLLIDGNTFNVHQAQSADPEVILGVWENGHAHGSNITVSNNHFYNLAASNDPTLNLERAYRITSHSSATSTVIYSGNTADGANIGFQWFASINTSGTLPIELTNNTVTNSNIGILIRSNGSAELSGNTFSNTGAMAGVGTGIEVDAGSAATIDGSVDENAISGFHIGILDHGSAIITGNSASIHDNTIGIDVDGGAATITGNHIFNNSTGVRFANSGNGSVSGNDFDGGSDPDNSTDLLIGATAGTVTIGDGNAFAAASTYIDNESAQNFNLSGLTATTFGDFNAATSTVPGNLASFYGVEDKIVDYLDQSSSGYVRIKSGNDFLANSSEDANVGSMQRLVYAATANDTAYVQAGVYVGANVVDSTDGVVAAVQINKALTLLGPQVDFDPTGAVPADGVQAILEPGSSDPLFNSSDVVGFEVISSNVTIKGFTFNGSNDATPGFVHNGGVFLHGVPIDAGESIVSYRGVSNIDIEHNIIENTDYTGIDFYNYDNGGAATSNNTIAYNLVQHLSDALGFGIGVLVYNNFYADVTNNVIQDVHGGVQTGNFSQANTGPTGSIADNTITAFSFGIFYNLMYDTSTALSITHNTISAENDASQTEWDGILITSIQSNVSTLASSNTIDGSGANGATLTVGIDVWNTPTTGLIQAGGDIISGVDYGVWVNSYEGYLSDGEAAHIKLSGEQISASQIGVYVEDSAANTHHPAVSAEITGDTDIITGGTGTGILVSGSNASANIHGNNASIHGNAIGIEVDGGSATVSGNHIYDNGTGVEFTGGGSGSISSNNFDDGVVGDGAQDNSTDLLIAASAGTVTIGSNNAFAGDTYFIDDQSSQSYDLSSDGTTFDETNNYRIEDKIHHQVDTDLSLSTGRITWVPDNVFVTTPGLGSTDSSIQRGVDAADGGFTVNVEHGTYTETVTVNKAITIDGEGNGPAPLVTLQSPTNGTNLIDVTSTTPSDDVTIKDIAFEGINGSNQAAVGVNVSSTANFGTLTIDRSTFTDLQFNGVSVFGNATTGISARDVVISNSTFTNNGVNNGGSGDIDLFMYNGDASLSNLILTNNGANGAQLGIQLRGVGGGNGSGVIAMGNVSLDNIDISGSYVRQFIGIQRYSDVTNLTFQDVKLGGATSKITGTFGDLLRFDEVGQGSVGSPATVNLGNTDFRGFDPGSPLKFAIEFAPDNTYAFLKADATQTLWDVGGPLDVVASALTTIQAFAVEDSILDYVDPNVGGQPFKGWALLQTGKAFVTADVVGFVDSINRGIAMVSTGGTVYASAGTYNEEVNVNKRVTLSGVKAGVTAPGRSGAESIINSPDGHTELTIGVSDATVDGFTIQGNTNGSLVGAGVYITPGNSGTHLLNNIIQNNIVGLFLANNSATDQAVIQGNLFQDNTNAGPAGGHGIYADQYTAGGAVQNVLITQNTFTNTNFVEDSWGIGMSNTDSAHPFTNFTVSSNTFSNAGRGIYFFDATNVSIDANTVSGASHYGIGLFGDVDTSFNIGRNTLTGGGDGVELVNEEAGSTDATGLSIHNNYLQNNSDDGVYVGSTVTATGDLQINANSISGNTHAGLENQSAVTIDATGNWWGDATGPFNATFNPGGLGDAIIEDPNIIIAPWLTSGVDTDLPQPGFQPSAGLGIDISGASSVNEGSTYTLNLNPSNPNQPNITSWDINWNDGSSIQHVMGDTASVTHVYLNGDQNHVISATATTTSGTATSNPVSVHVNDVLPSVTISKSHTGTISEGTAGQTITYHFTVTNSSAATTDPVTVSSLSDSVLGNLMSAFLAANGNRAVITDGQSVSFDVVYNVPVANANALINNTVTVNVQDDEGDSTSANAHDSVSYGDVLPSVTISKSHTGTISEGTAGQTITYHFTVTNSSAATTDPVTVSSLSDSVLGNLMSAFLAANGNSAVITDGQSVSFDVVYSVPVANANTLINNTVTVNVQDDEGDATSANAHDSVSYGDVLPSVTISKSHTGTISEGTAGQTITYHFTVTNSSAATTDPVTVSSLSDSVLGNLMSAFLAANGNSAVITDGQSVSFDVVYNVPVANANALINNTVTVNVQDDEGDSTSANAHDSVSYGDVLPSVTISKSHTGTISEGTAGQTITYHFTVTNSSAATTDPVTVSSLSDSVLGNLMSAFLAANGNSAVITDGQSVSFDVVYSVPVANANTLINNTVTVNVQDDEGDATSANASDSVSYGDVLPVASIDSISTPRQEGTPITVTGSAIDSATTDPITFTWNIYKNGNPTPYATGSGSSFVFTPDNNGSYNIVLTVTDDELNSNTTSQLISVANVAPIVSLIGPTSANEGSAQHYTFTTSDPGADTFSIVATSGGSVGTVSNVVFNSNSGAGSFDVTFSDGPATSTVSVQVEDSDGADSNIATINVSVNNVAPTITLIGPSSANQGQTLHYTFTTSDPGVDTFSFVANSGGAYGTVSNLVFNPNGSGSFDVTFNAPPGHNTSTVSIQDQDSDGAPSNVSSIVVNIANTLQVTNFQFNNSGFDVTFNRAINLADLNLYDGADTAVDLPDVTLVGDHVGAVTGSIIWNDATNTLSFIKTGGVLTDDTYHVTLISGQNGADPLSLGFHDAFGNLDGNANFDDSEHPDDYTHSFSISTAPGTRVVSIKDFARGPGQHVDDNPAAPGLSRMAVSVDNATGVMSLDFQLAYNPALLTINGASLVTGLPGSWIITVNTTTPGLLKVSASGTQALSGTDQPIVLIDATVPATAPYEASEVLQLLNVKLNGNFIASKADFAVQKVAYLGDADGSGGYGAADGVFIQRVAVNLDTGFDASDWTDPVIIGDIVDAPNTTPSIDGFDASLVLQKALHQPVPQLPDLPGVPLVFAPSGVDPTLTVPSNIQNVGGQVTVGISINVDPAAANKVYGITFDVTYDGTQLQFIQPGNPNSLLGSYLPVANGWNAAVYQANTNDLAVEIYNITQPAPVGSGTIVNLTFQLLASDSSGVINVGINKNSDPHEDGVVWTLNAGSISYAFLRGDVNFDGHVNAADIVAMMSALTNLPQYEATYHLTPQQAMAVLDIDQDNSITNADLQKLLTVLISGSGSTSKEQNAAATSAPPAADVTTASSSEANTKTQSNPSDSLSTTGTAGFNTSGDGSPPPIVDSTTPATPNLSNTSDSQNNLLSVVVASTTQSEGDQSGSTDASTPDTLTSLAARHRQTLFPVVDTHSAITDISAVSRGSSVDATFRIPKADAIDDFYESLTDDFVERAMTGETSGVSNAYSNSANDSLFDSSDFQLSDALIAEDSDLMLAHL